MRRLVAGALVLACWLAGCETVDDASAAPTVVYEMSGLECRSELMEIVTSDYGSDTIGEPTPEAALTAFFDLPINDRFAELELAERDGLGASYVDEAGLTQLVIRLTDEFDGFLVASYSNCIDLP